MAQAFLVKVPHKQRQEGGEEAALVRVHVLETLLVAHLVDLGLDCLGALARSEELLARDLKLLVELRVGREEENRLAATLGDVLVLLLDHHKFLRF